MKAPESTIELVGKKIKTPEGRLGTISFVGSHSGDAWVAFPENSVPIPVPWSRIELVP